MRGLCAQPSFRGRRSHRRGVAAALGRAASQLLCGHGRAKDLLSASKSGVFSGGGDHSCASQDVVRIFQGHGSLQQMVTAHLIWPQLPVSRVARS